MRDDDSRRAVAAAQIILPYVSRLSERDRTRLLGDGELLRFFADIPTRPVALDDGPAREPGGRVVVAGRDPGAPAAGTQRVASRRRCTGGGHRPFAACAGAPHAGPGSMTRRTLRVQPSSTTRSGTELDRDDGHRRGTAAPQIALFDGIGTAHSLPLVAGLDGAAERSGVRRQWNTAIRPPSAGDDECDWDATRGFYAEFCERGTFSPIAYRAACRRAIKRAAAAKCPLFCDLAVEQLLASYGPPLRIPMRSVWVVHQVPSPVDGRPLTTRAKIWLANPRKWRRHLRTLHTRAVLRSLARSGGRFVVHSPAARERLARIVPRDRIDVVGWPIASRANPPEPAPGAGRDAVAVFPGEARAGKGLDVLLEALPHIAELALLDLPSVVTEDAQRLVREADDSRIRVGTTWLTNDDYQSHLPRRRSPSCRTGLPRWRTRACPRLCSTCSRSGSRPSSHAPDRRSASRRVRGRRRRRTRLARGARGRGHRGDARHRGAAPSPRTSRVPPSCWRTTPTSSISKRSARRVRDEPMRSRLTGGRTLERDKTLRSEGTDAKDIFIVGPVRSGTSWLQTMLAEHPDIASPPETHFFTNYLAPLEPRGNTTGRSSPPRWRSTASTSGTDSRPLSPTTSSMRCCGRCTSRYGSSCSRPSRARAGSSRRRPITRCASTRSASSRPTPRSSTWCATRATPCARSSRRTAGRGGGGRRPRSPTRRACGCRACGRRSPQTGSTRHPRALRGPPLRSRRAGARPRPSSVSVPRRNGFAAVSMLRRRSGRRRSCGATPRRGA